MSTGAQGSGDHEARPHQVGLSTEVPRMATKTTMWGGILALLTLFAAGTAPGFAQERADSIQEVRLVDGSTFYGVLIDDGDPIEVRLLSGAVLTIPRSRVRSIQPAGGTVRDGEIWRQDPNLTRLFFAPTGRTMPKGTGYLAAYELVFPFVAFAPTDNFLIAAGTPLFGDLDRDRVVYFAPKLNVYSRNDTHVALGAFHFEELGGQYSEDRYGAFYAVLTQGTSDAAITLAIGAGYDAVDFYDEPLVMLGGEFRVARTIKLVTENYLIPEASMFSVGPRFFSERLSADLGIGFLVADSEHFTVPIVNFVYVF